MRLNYEKFLSWPLSFFASCEELCVCVCWLRISNAMCCLLQLRTVAFLMKKFLTLFHIFSTLAPSSASILCIFSPRFAPLVFTRSCATAVFSRFIHLLDMILSVMLNKASDMLLIIDVFSVGIIIDWKRVIDLLTKFSTPFFNQRARSFSGKIHSATKNKFSTFTRKSVTKYENPLLVIKTSYIQPTPH